MHTTHTQNMLGQLWMEVRAELRDQEGGAA
jgi:predicted NAD-dependent protein-ADP-ribosyltransferase YbiA (DUF1768 family)